MGLQEVKTFMRNEELIRKLESDISNRFGNGQDLIDKLIKKYMLKKNDLSLIILFIKNLGRRMHWISIDIKQDLHLDRQELDNDYGIDYREVGLDEFENVAYESEAILCNRAIKSIHLLGLEKLSKKKLEAYTKKRYIENMRPIISKAKDITLKNIEVNDFTYELLKSQFAKSKQALSANDIKTMFMNNSSVLLHNIKFMKLIIENSSRSKSIARLFEQYSYKLPKDLFIPNIAHEKPLHMYNSIVASRSFLPIVCFIPYKIEPTKLHIRMIVDLLKLVNFSENPLKDDMKKTLIEFLKLMNDDEAVNNEISAYNIELKFQAEPI